MFCPTTLKLHYLLAKFHPAFHRALTLTMYKILMTLLLTSNYSNAVNPRMMDLRAVKGAEGESIAENNKVHFINMHIILLFVWSGWLNQRLVFSIQDVRPELLGKLLRKGLTTLLNIAYTEHRFYFWFPADDTVMTYWHSEGRNKENHFPESCSDHWLLIQAENSWLCFLYFLRQSLQTDVPHSSWVCRLHMDTHHGQ